MKICPTCQQTYPDEIESCPRDGSQLAADVRDERECPHCAELILKKARVCKHCGRDVEPLTGGEAPVQVPSLAPPQGTTEMRSPQAQPSKTATPAGRQPVTTKMPSLRGKPEPPSRMKYVVVAGVVLILLVVGGWYFSRFLPTGPKKGEVMFSPKDGLKYVWIPPGSFMMGCSPGDNQCDDSEKPSHRVTISRGFWMGQTPVTVGAYKRFSAAAGRNMPDSPDSNAGWANENMPAVNVTWDDAQAYCGWMGGRLPTEAEREYAARGGSTEARYGPIDEIALSPNPITASSMHDVAQKRANGFGLYDMLGNVWEWVSDWCDDHYYQNSPSRDPTGPAKGQYRVLRGGFEFYAHSWDVRASSRARNLPTFRNGDFGFRCGGDALHTVPFSSPEAQAQLQAEAERKRQAEEKAREIKEALGDEIDAQIGYLGMIAPTDLSLFNSNPSFWIKRGHLDQMNGYQIQNLRMFVNRKNGALTISFGCRFNNGPNAPARMLVRLFDGNGEYLTHFVTAEYFAAPNCRYLSSRPDSCNGAIPLKQASNVLNYSVNLRDAAYVQRAEFGLYTGR